MAGYLKYADFDSTLLRFNCIGFYVILDFAKKKKILNLQVQGFKLKVTESANKFPFWKLCSCKYSTHNRASTGGPNNRHIHSHENFQISFPGHSQDRPKNYGIKTK